MVNFSNIIQAIRPKWRYLTLMYLTTFDENPSQQISEKYLIPIVNNCHSVAGEQ